MSDLDAGAARLLAAREAGATEQEIAELELELIQQSDNRPTEADLEAHAELEAE